jgi:hypothetical protein
MGIAERSRKIKSPAAATGRVGLFHAAFAALIRDPTEWADVSIGTLPPGRKPT